MNNYNIDDNIGSKIYAKSRAKPANDVTLDFIPAAQGEDRYPNDIDFFKSMRTYKPYKLLSLSEVKVLAYNVGLVLCGSAKPPIQFAAHLSALILNMPLDKSDTYNYAFGMFLSTNIKETVTPQLSFGWEQLQEVFNQPLERFLSENPMVLGDYMTPLPKPGNSKEFAKIDKTLIKGNTEAFVDDWKTCLAALQAQGVLTSERLETNDRDVRDIIMAIALTGMIFLRTKIKDQAQIQQSLLMRFSTTVFTFISNQRVIKTGLIVGSKQISKICHYMSSQTEVFRVIFNCILVYNLATTRKIPPYTSVDHLELNGRFHAALLNSMSYGCMPLLRAIQTGAAVLNLEIMTFVRALCIAPFAETLRNIVDSVNAGAFEYPLYTVLDQTNLNYMCDPIKVVVPFTRTGIDKKDEPTIKGSTWVWARITDPDAYDAMRGPKHLTLYCTCAFVIALVDKESRILNSVHINKVSRADKVACYSIAQAVVMATKLDPYTAQPGPMSNPLTSKVAEYLGKQPKETIKFDSLDVFLSKRGVEAENEVSTGGIDVSAMKPPVTRPRSAFTGRGRGRGGAHSRGAYVDEVTDAEEISEEEEDQNNQHQPQQSAGQPSTAHPTNTQQRREPAVHYDADNNQESDDAYSDDEGAEKFNNLFP